MNMITSTLLAAGFSLLAGSAAAKPALPTTVPRLVLPNRQAIVKATLSVVPLIPLKSSAKRKKSTSWRPEIFCIQTKRRRIITPTTTKRLSAWLLIPSRRLAMALNCMLKQWANNGYNKNNISGIPDKEPADTKTDFNGKSYTKTIVDACGSNCPAAYYAYNYTTAGTSKGDWFLPSGGQLWLMEQNKSAIKMGLAKAGGKFPFGNSIYTYIESSNEGPDLYKDFKMSVYLDFDEKSTSYLSNGNKYKSAYLDKCFSCPFISF